MLGSPLKARIRRHETPRSNRGHSWSSPWLVGSNGTKQVVIDYLLEENRVLKALLRGPRLRFTDDERRRLAAKGKAVGRKLLAEVAGIVTPDTILAWHRKLIAKKVGL